MLDADMATAKKALINIIGGESLTLREAETIFQEVASRISSDALIKWGALFDCADVDMPSPEPMTA